MTTQFVEPFPLLFPVAPLSPHQEGRNGSARWPGGVQTGEGLDDSQGHDVVSLPWLHAPRYGYVGDAIA